MSPSKAGKAAYEVFSFVGHFCHESQHHSATPQLLEVLHGENPEQIQVKIQAQDAAETFEAIVEMKLIRVEKHSYKRPDHERNERDRKFARQSKKLIAQHALNQFH
jgi:hypothetical protein